MEAEYGGFDAYYQKLVTQLAGGTAADIIQIDYKWVSDLAAQGELFVNMNDLKDRIDMSGFDLNFAHSYGAVGNYLLGLPTGLNALTLAANMDFLKEMGIKLDNDWDWDKILEAGVKVQQKDKNKHLLYLTTNHFNYLLKTYMKQKTGNNFIKDDFTFGFKKEELVDAFAYIRKMVDLGVVSPFEESVLFDHVGSEQNNNWLAGKYGFLTQWASAVPPVMAYSSFPMDVTRYPVPKDAVDPGILTTPSQFLSINKRSKNIDEAIKFVDWFFNDEEAILILKDCRGVPPTVKARELLAEKQLINPVVAKGVDVSLPFSGGPENALSLNKEVETIMHDYIQQVGFRRMSPEQAADNLMRDLQQKLDELKAWR
ncbi:MAG: extracellular solute-binding protein [Firmicutes bacterium]|nr:extracellular solute-binding protein [Bacillota bacterium]